MHIHKRNNDIILNQTGYIEIICQNKTPNDRELHTSSFKFNPKETTQVETSDKKDYLSQLMNNNKLMKQMYLGTRTRPDILINTSILASRKILLNWTSKISTHSCHT